MITELEWVWKEPVVAYFKVYPGTFIKGLSKTTKATSPPARTAGVQTEIRTKNLQNNSQDRYCLSKLSH
jgi:hypothetical protein